MNRVEVLFEHTSYGFVWRGVRGADGGHRVEKRGVNAERWSVVVWAGSREALDDYRPGGALMQSKYHRPDYMRKLRRGINRCRARDGHPIGDCDDCRKLREALIETLSPPVERAGPPR
jgi:hypothetical protein